MSDLADVDPELGGDFEPARGIYAGTLRPLLKHLAEVPREATTAPAFILRKLFPDHSWDRSLHVDTDGAKARRRLSAFLEGRISDLWMGAGDGPTRLDRLARQPTAARLQSVEEALDASADNLRTQDTRMGWDEVIVWIAAESVARNTLQRRVNRLDSELVAFVDTHRQRLRRMLKEATPTRDVLDAQAGVPLTRTAKASPGGRS